MFRRVAQGIFVAACVGVAWYAWASWSEALPQYKVEALAIPTFLLYALTLPVSLLVQAVYTGLALVTPIDRLDMGTTFLSWLFRTWGPLTIAGYLQWFVILPWLWRRWKTRRSRGTAPSV